VPPDEDLYHGVLAASVALEMAGHVEELRRVLAASGVSQAVLIAVAEMRRDADNDAVLARTLRLVRLGGPSQIGPLLAPVLAHSSWRAAGTNMDTVVLDEDHPILHDPDYAVPLVPAVLGGSREPIQPVKPASFTPLEHSGIRNTGGALWLALVDDAPLRRLALGVRADGGTYELLVEGPPPTLDLVTRAASAVVSDRRVHAFAVRPVAAGDPALDDTHIVYPLRRYPDAPRSRATLLGEALPIASGLDITDDDLDQIRAVLRAKGVRRASLCFVESRILAGVEGRVIARDPVQVTQMVRRLFETRKPTVLFVDGTDPQRASRFARVDRVTKELERRVPSLGLAVEITDMRDALLEPGEYAIGLL
jgi:hypothetical protein